MFFFFTKLEQPCLLYNKSIQINYISRQTKSSSSRKKHFYCTKLLAVKSVEFNKKKDCDFTIQTNQRCPENKS